MLIFFVNAVSCISCLFCAPLCVRDETFEAQGGYDFYEAKNKISSMKFEKVCSSLSEFFSTTHIPGCYKDLQKVRD